MKLKSFFSALLLASIFSIAVSAQTTTFSNSTRIAISAGAAAVASPYPSNITVSGVTGNVSKVTVVINGLTHTWSDDVGILLVGPTGVKVRLMTDVGFGSEPTGVVLTFDDTGALLPDKDAYGSGTYRPTQGTGGDGQQGATHPENFPSPAPAGPYSITLSSFNNVNANGTWSLYVDDDTAGDGGEISGGWSLNITTGGTTPTPTPTPTVTPTPSVTPTPTTPADANVDMNGDGRTDFVVIRETMTPPADKSARETLGIRRFMANRRNLSGINPKSLAGSFPLYWYTSINGTGATSVVPFGDSALDFPTPEDFDGDGKDDIAVWRTGAQGIFYILQSSNNTLRTELFGQTGDDPGVVGDYDGDNKADPAVFRCPPQNSAAAQCYFYFRGSSNNPNRNITYVPWGFGTAIDLFPNPGDFDGDGKYDFVVQRTRPGSTSDGQFVLLRSSDFGVEYINWGLNDDVILPGDYDGDRKSDFALLRESNSGLYQYYILERDGGGTGASPIIWGVTNDIPVPGDYDGDGKQDIAIQRQSSDPTQNYFYVRRSSNNSLLAFEWGGQGDFPAALWYVH